MNLRHLFWGGGALGVVLMAAWIGQLWLGPGQQDMPPRDVALAPRDLPDPLHLVILGTSLSLNERWTDQLSEGINACLGPSEITVIAQPGAGVIWGQGQVGAVAEADPDLVLVEFAINDADVRDGLGRADADAEARRLLDALAVALPEAALVEMTMSPAHGLRGVLRPGLAEYYSDLITRGRNRAPGGD